MMGSSLSREIILAVTHSNQAILAFIFQVATVIYNAKQEAYRRYRALPIVSSDASGDSAMRVGIAKLCGRRRVPTTRLTE